MTKESLSRQSAMQEANEKIIEHENFTFTKEEFLNQISIASAFRIASHYGKISYLYYIMTFMRWRF